MPRTVLPVVLATAILVAWLFGPALTGTSTFGFRDAAHYYHPLFEYIRGEWGAGRLPLWNPYENCGTPLVAEATSSVFYPGKLWFALPLDYTWLYNQYIVLHVVLAAVTAYRLARHLKAAPLGATLGAISYAFSGYVLFQYCNVIFLVGAAWLPWALQSADQLLRQGRGAAILGLGVSLALIVLGGDPHLAYNVALAAVGYAVLLWRADRRGATGVRRQNNQNVRRLVPLAVALALAGLLAAVQILPTLEASRYGARAQFDSPRSVYELVSVILQPREGSQASLDGLLSSGKRGHHSQIYAFSLEPWRVIELLWPNVTGAPFPTHRRWMNALGIEANLWTPSLYVGLLPVLLALRQWSVRAYAPIVVRGLSWLALLSLLGSLGAYGLGSVLNEFTGDPQSFGIGSEFGGLYWLLTVAVPGYVQFRYPSKLLVLTSLALSMLAARQWRRSWTPAGSMTLFLALVPVLSAIGGIAAFVAKSPLRKRIAELSPNAFLGPFDGKGAWTDYFGALLHASILAVALLLIYRLAKRNPSRRRIWQTAALAIVALDLAVAQKPLICLEPSYLWQFRPPVLDKLALGDSYRLFRQLGPIPASFKMLWSAERYADSVRWDRETLYPKFPLPLHVPLVDASQNVAGFDYETLLEVAVPHNKRTSGVQIPDPSILDLLAARTAIVVPDAAKQLTSPTELAEGLVLGERPEALPRAWIVHEVEQVKVPARASQSTIRKLTEQICFPAQQPRDWRRQAVVESELPDGFQPSAARDPQAESCTIRHADPLRVEIEARLTSPGLVILSDQFFPGWQLTVVSDGQARRAPILRANRVMRAAALPAGEHRLIYQYRPKSVYWGGTISVTAAITTIIWGATRRRSSNRTPGRVGRGDAIYRGRQI